MKWLQPNILPVLLFPYPGAFAKTAVSLDLFLRKFWTQHLCIPIKPVKSARLPVVIITVSWFLSHIIIAFDKRISRLRVNGKSYKRSVQKKY